MYDYQPDPYEPLDIERRKRHQQEMAAAAMQGQSQSPGFDPYSPQGQEFLQQVVEAARQRNQQNREQNDSGSGLLGLLGLLNLGSN